MHNSEVWELPELRSSAAVICGVHSDLPGVHGRFSAPVMEAFVLHRPIISAHSGVMNIDGCTIDVLVSEGDDSFETLSRMRPAVAVGDCVFNCLPVVLSNGSFNYYHFVTEDLARLIFLASKDLLVPDNYVLVSECGKAFQRELFNIVGVTPLPVSALSMPVTLGDIVYVPQPRYRSSMIGPSTVRLVRDFFRDRMSAAAPPTRRLYFSRRNALRRRIVNERDVEQLLVGFGFEIICGDEISVAEQLKLCLEASIIVGPHGAALTNCIVAPPSSILLELHSPHKKPRNFYNIAHIAGLRGYHCLVGDDAEGSTEGEHRDFRVSIRKLQRVLELILSYYLGKAK